MLILKRFGAQLTSLPLFIRKGETDYLCCFYNFKRLILHVYHESDLPSLIA